MRKKDYKKQVYLLGSHCQTLVLNLADGVSRKLNHQTKSALDHLPLVQVEAGHNRHELTEVVLVEVPAQRALDHVLHPLHRGRPHVVPRSIDLEVDLELLKQPHQVVQMLRQRQVDHSLLNILEILLVFFGLLFLKQLLLMLMLLLLHSLESLVNNHLCSLDHFMAP